MVLIFVKKEYRILGGLSGTPDVDNFDFKINNDGVEVLVNFKPKSMMFISQCKVEISEEFFEFLKTRLYKGIAVFETTWILNEGLDPLIVEEFYDESTQPLNILANATKKVLFSLKYFMNQIGLNNIATGISVNWSEDGQTWDKYPPKRIQVSADVIQVISINQDNLLQLQECIDGKLEPFIAMDFLHKAMNENTPIYKWIYATIAAELAIKEFLIEKDWRLGVLLNEVQSPPLHKLYGPILKTYTGLDPAMKPKDIQNAIEVRNRLLHRPKEVIIDLDTANTYVHNVKGLVYQLFTNLYPGFSILSKTYPPRVGLGEYKTVKLQ